jgi:hypothetical protein
VQWGWPIEVLLELPMEDARRRVAADMGTLEQTRDGVLLRTQGDALEYIARYLVQLECPFRVLHPPELREAVRQLSRQLARYARRSDRIPRRRTAHRMAGTSARTLSASAASA